MSPPELARNAPRLDVLEPIEVGLLPGRRHELGLALAHRGDRRLSEGLGVDVPLIGKPWLDDRVRPVAMRHGVGMRLDLSQKSGERHHLDDPGSRDEAVLAVDSGDEPRVVVVALQPLEEVDIALERHAALRIEDIDRPHALGLVPLADFEIVEVVRRRDLDRACAFFRIGIFVGDNRGSAGRPAAGEHACRTDAGSARRPDAPRPQCRPASSRAAWWRRSSVRRSLRPPSPPPDTRSSRGAHWGFWRGPWRAPPRRAARRPRAPI